MSLRNEPMRMESGEREHTSSRLPQLSESVIPTRAPNDMRFVAHPLEGSGFSLHGQGVMWQGKPSGQEGLSYRRLLFLAEELAGNDQLLNFAGALADGTELDVAVILFGGVVLDEAVAAMDLHAFVGDAGRGFAGEELGHAGFAREADIFLIGKPRSLINEQARGLHFRGHVGELELDGLELTDGLAELLALFGVAHRGIECALRHAEAKRRDGDAPAIENLEAA